MDQNPFSTFELKTATSLLGIHEQGGYVTDWKVKDSNGNWKSILYSGTELKRTGIPILFPYYGPSESGMGQHGFGRNVKWNVVEKTDNQVTLEITDADLSEETQKLYPYQFQAEITLKLMEDSFEYSLRVKNLGSEPLPIAPGLHPYWSVDHAKKMEVTLEGYSEFNSANVDWDKNPPDVEYPFRNPVTINFGNHKVTIEDRSNQVKKLVVWSQPVDAPDHNFICFEPVTLERGSFDKNPIFVPTQESWNMNLQFIQES